MDHLSGSLSSTALSHATHPNLIHLAFHDTTSSMIRSQEMAHTSEYDLDMQLPR